MQFCQGHWDTLKKAIDERGLSHLIAKDGQAAVAEAKDQLNGTTDPSVAPDPLMQAHWMITGRVMEIAGLGMMYEEECAICDLPTGHCPLCEVEHGAGPGSAQNWINGCADQILAEYRQSGWMLSAH